MAKTKVDQLEADTAPSRVKDEYSSRRRGSGMLEQRFRTDYVAQLEISAYNLELWWSCKFIKEDSIETFFLLSVQ